MKTFAVIAILTLGQNLWAGQITLQGISNLRHPVEMVSIPIKVRSRCATSPQQSSELLEKAVSAIKEVVQKDLQLGAGNRDQLVQSGESTTVQDEYVAQQSAPLCVQAWSTTQSLLIKTTNLKEVEALQIDLLTEISTLTTAPTDLQVDLQAAEPALLPETAAQIETDAMKSALVDASTKLKAVMQVCSMTNIAIKSISQGAAVVRDYHDGDVPAGDLNFDLQYVHESWDVTWTFKDQSGFCQ